MRRMVRFVVISMALLSGVTAGYLVTPCMAETKSGSHPEQGGESGGHSGEEQGPITANKPDANLGLWTLAVFIIFLIVLKKYAWGPLIAGLNEREVQIKRDIADAESARVQAEKMLAQHTEKLERVQEEVKAILAEARRDAEHTKNEIVAVAQKEAEANRQRAVLEIERAKEQALDELFGQMTKVVWTATEHVVGRTLTEGDHERLITEAVASVSGKKS